MSALRIGCLAFVISTSALAQTQFANVDEALRAVAQGPQPAKWNAVQYLAAHANQSLPQLFDIVERQKPGWVYASTAIARSKDDRALSFLTHLLADNFFLKEADGTRKVFGLGSKNGCLVQPNLRGSVLADTLGDLGDRRAIPTLRQAVIEGDTGLKRSAYGALYKLGGVSLDNLFSLARSEDYIRDVVEQIGLRARESDPQFAISVFDRAIASFADDPHQVAGAHFWKMCIFEDAKDFDAALREADAVIKFTKYENLTSQAREARARIRSKMKNSG